MNCYIYINNIILREVEEGFISIHIEPIQDEIQLFKTQQSIYSNTNNFRSVIGQI